MKSPVLKGIGLFFILKKVTIQPIVLLISFLGLLNSNIQQLNKLHYSTFPVWKSGIVF